MPRRLLIVDDDPTIRTSLAEALADNGTTEVGVAEGPHEALAMLDAAAPDVVLGLSLSREKIADRHRPAGNSRLGLGQLAAGVRGRPRWIVGQEDADHLLLQQVDIPLPAKIGETLYHPEISVQGGEMNR